MPRFWRVILIYINFLKLINIKYNVLLKSIKAEDGLQSEALAKYGGRSSLLHCITGASNSYLGRRKAIYGGRSSTGPDPALRGSRILDFAINKIFMQNRD